MARSMAGNKPRTRCDSMDDLPEKLGFRKRSVSCAIYPRFYTTDNTNGLSEIIAGTKNMEGHFFCCLK